MGKKVAIVTGANRGIGFAVVRRLCEELPQWDVILTGRSEAKGKKACARLKAEGLNPLWQELDVTQSASARMFKDFILDNYGGVDILVSNAGAVFPKDSPLSLSRQAELMVKTNVKGTIEMLKLFSPLLRPQSRVVILSSDWGLLSGLDSGLRQKFDLDHMTLYDIEKLADQYVSAVKADVWEKYGWPGRMMAAIGVLQNALAYIMARDLKSDQRQNILVNAGCPGITATDAMETYLDASGCLGDVRANDVETAANGIVWLATLQAGKSSPNGDAVLNREILNFRG